MKPAYLMAIIFSILVIGITSQDSEGQVIGNQAYLMEGGGFAVTEESIQISQIDILMSTQSQVGSRIPILIDDGFVTLNDQDFAATDLSGTLRMNGRFLTITGTAESFLGDEIKVSLTGKLIQHSDEGSVYSFTGRLTEGIVPNKIIYTTKISSLAPSVPTPTEAITPTMAEKEIIVHILPGSYEQGFGTDYIQASKIQAELRETLGEGQIRARYFNPERLTINPGTTLTFVNDDTVSHSVDSAKRDTERKGGGHPIPDGRITSGEIAPGEKWSVTIEDVGFIFLIDKDYPWMTMDIVSFPETESEVIRRAADSQPQN